MMLLIMVISTAMLWTETGAIAIGDACTNHTMCNYEGSSPVDHTKCDSSAGSTCQCILFHYGETGATKCVKALIGDSCAGKANGTSFCQTRDLNSLCSSSSLCECRSGFYESRSLVDGYGYCSKITIGVRCNSSDSGDAFCQTSISNAVCDEHTQTCQCPEQQTYVRHLGVCHFESNHPECLTCIGTGGACYDIEDDDNPEGCACSEAKNSSVSDGDLATGCDRGFAEVGERCSHDGTSVRCVSDHAICLHAGGMNAKFTCTCRPGYQAIPFGEQYKCYSRIAKETDRNCQWCEHRGGICYDIEEEDVRDGCMCPSTRSTTDLDDPSTDCEQDHVNVTCSASKMKICYTPHNSTRYSNIGTKLANRDAYLYIDKHLGQDPCRFEQVDSGNDWCLELDLSTNATAACGTSIGYTSEDVIRYSNLMVLQTSPLGRRDADSNVQVYCKYDTIAHAFSAGADIVEFASIAAEGKEMHPVLKMDVRDEFSRDATVQGIRIGQPTKLIIEMTENANVYEAIRPDVCLASSRPDLANPATLSLLLLHDGCPVTSSSYLDTTNMFYPDPSNPEVSSTGFFPMLQFDTNLVFFHCAVRLCRNGEDCSVKSCSSARKKRAVIFREESPERHIRDLTSRHVMESVSGGPIKVLSKEQVLAMADGTGYKKKGPAPLGIPKKYVILGSIGMGVFFVLIAICAGLMIMKRRNGSEARKSSSAQMLFNNPQEPAI